MGDNPRDGKYVSSVLILLTFLARVFSLNYKTWET